MISKKEENPLPENNIHPVDKNKSTCSDYPPIPTGKDAVSKRNDRLKSIPLSKWGNKFN